MKRKLWYISTVLFIGLILAKPASAAGIFSDVDGGAPYAQAVEYVSSRGIICGYSDGSFRPDNSFTRGQMAAVISRMLGEDEPTELNGSLFTDVPQSHWANAYITRIASLNIISGYSNGTFRPDSPLNDYQGITMLVRAFGLREEAERAGGYPAGYLSVAGKYRLLDGVDVGSGGNIRRHEIATIIYNWYHTDRADTKEPASTGFPKVGTYLSNSDGYVPGELVISQINPDDMMVFSVNWERLAGLDDVKAVLSGSRAVFHYSEEGLSASGYIDFRKDGSASLTIEASNDDYILNTGCEGWGGAEFRFAPGQDLKLREEASIWETLLKNTDQIGWMGQSIRTSSGYDRYYLRFYEDSTIKIFHVESYYSDWDVAITDTSFELDGSTLRIGNSQYKAVVDHTATLWLYLTALNSDSYSIAGMYELGLGDGVFENTYSGDDEYRDCVSIDRIRAAEDARG